MQRTLITLLLLLYALSPMAQVFFKPGYVVTTAGDTLDGYLAYQDVKKNYSCCRFKPKLFAPETIYSPTEIKAFYYYGHHLFSSLQLPAHLSRQTVFVQHILTGPISLYKYQQQYLLDSAGVITLLPLYEKNQYRETEILNKTLVYFQSIIKRCPDINYLLISNYKNLDQKKIRTIYEYLFTCLGWKYLAYNHYSGFEINYSLGADPFFGRVPTEQIIAVGHKEIKNIVNSKEWGFFAHAGIIIKDPSIPVNLEIKAGYFYHQFLTKQNLSYPAFTFRTDAVSLSGYRHGMAFPLILNFDLFTKQQSNVSWQAFLGMVPILSYSQKVHFIQDRTTEIQGETVVLYNFYVGDADRKDLLGFKGGLKITSWPIPNFSLGLGMIHTSDLYRNKSTVFKYSHLSATLDFKYYVSF